MLQIMTPSLNLKRIKKIHHIVGTLLYYAQAVDCTVIISLNTIAEQQYKPTELTYKAITKILDYSVKHTNVVVRYKSIHMVLHVHIYYSYLIEPISRIRVGGKYFMRSRSAEPSKKPKNPTKNVPLHTK